MNSKAFRSLALLCLVATVCIPFPLHASKPDAPESEEKAFKSWRELCDMALCLRLEDGFVSWRGHVVQEPEYDPYFKKLLKETDSEAIAVFPDHKSKLADVARVLALLGKLEVAPVVLTPPVSDQTFARLTNRAP
jgi:hypothetical protein